jgi:quercetin dioxygenase-like cupin family protein
MFVSAGRCGPPTATGQCWVGTVATASRHHRARNHIPLKPFADCYNQALAKGSVSSMSTAGEERLSDVQHIRLADMPTEHLNPLLDRQFVSGKKAMLARLVLRAGCVVPLHRHENEQITYILEGALKFSLQGKDIIVRAGEILVIPADVPHSAEALEDTVDLDVFCPPRADWISGADAYLRK